MKITTVSVELNRKKTVDFQSWGNSVGLTADVDEGDDPVAVVRELQKTAAGLLIKMEGKKDRTDTRAESRGGAGSEISRPGDK